MSELPTPITTVRVASDAVGRLAATVIVDLVEGRPGRAIELPSELVVRASSGPPPPRREP
jgi:LacI family transcriptional regulator